MNNMLKNECRNSLARLGLGIAAVMALRNVFINLVATGGNYFTQMAVTVVYAFVIPVVAFYGAFKLKAADYSESGGKTAKTARKNNALLALSFVPLLYMLGRTGSSLMEIISRVAGFGFNGNAYLEIMPHGFAEAAMFIAVNVLIAPLAEEIIFRGIMLKPLRKLGDLSAIILTALCFALFHGNVSQLLYAFLCGVALGYAGVLFGGIKATVVIHILYNVLAILLYAMPSDAAFILDITLLCGGLAALYFLLKKARGTISPSPLGRAETFLIIAGNPFFIIAAALLMLALR